MLLDVLYGRGIGINNDKGKAMEFFEKFSKENNAITQFMLGTYYLIEKRK